MAAEIYEDADGRVLAVRVSGKLTTEDYEHFVPAVERQIGQHGKVRMVVDMHDFHGWKAGALWEDTKFAYRHYSDLERLAIVGDKAWEHGMAVFCRPFTKADVRYFDRTRADEANSWIHSDLPVLEART